MESSAWKGEPTHILGESEALGLRIRLQFRMPSLWELAMLVLLMTAAMALLKSLVSWAGSCLLVLLMTAAIALLKLLVSWAGSCLVKQIPLGGFWFLELVCCLQAYCEAPFVIRETRPRLRRFRKNILWEHVEVEEFLMAEIKRVQSQEEWMEWEHMKMEEFRMAEIKRVQSLEEWMEWEHMKMEEIRMAEIRLERNLFGLGIPDWLLKQPALQFYLGRTIEFAHYWMGFRRTGAKCIADSSHQQSGGGDLAKFLRDERRAISLGAGLFILPGVAANESTPVPLYFPTSSDRWTSYMIVLVAFAAASFLLAGVCGCLNFRQRKQKETRSEPPQMHLNGNKSVMINFYHDDKSFNRRL